MTVFACGRNASFYGSIISSADGVSWADETLPGTPRAFHAIHGSADNDVYVTGRGRTHHFDGATWVLDDAVFGGILDTAYGIWVSPDGTKVYAVVGKRSTHKISGVWTEGSQSFVYFMNCLWGFNPAANEIYTGHRHQDPTIGAGIRQYDGVGDYFDVHVAWEPGSYRGFYGIWGTGPNALWAASGYDYQAPHPSRVGRIYKWNGSALSVEYTTAVGEAMFAIHGVDGNNIWAVGGAGTILHYNGTAWTPQSSGTSFDLFAVWAASATEVWAGGSYGPTPILLKYNGTSWAPVDISGTNLASVYGLYGTPSAAPTFSSTNIDRIFVVAQDVVKIIFTSAVAVTPSLLSAASYSVDSLSEGLGVTVQEVLPISDNTTTSVLLKVSRPSFNQPYQLTVAESLIHDVDGVFLAAQVVPWTHVKTKVDSAINSMPSMYGTRHHRTNIRAVLEAITISDEEIGGTQS